MTIKLTSGQRLLIRWEPADDLSLAREIFIDEVYRSPHRLDPLMVKDLVDVGANVGYSILLFLWQYPGARIDAFEPHPLHYGRIESHLKVNFGSGRATIHPVPVGTKACNSRLTDAGVGSQPYLGLLMDLESWWWISLPSLDQLKLTC